MEHTCIGLLARCVFELCFFLCLVQNTSKIPSLFRMFISKRGCYLKESSEQCARLGVKSDFVQVENILNEEG